MGTMRLPVELTDAEMLEAGKRMSKALDDLEAVKAKKREAVSGFNAEIKGFEGTVHTLNEVLKSGAEEREVEVREEPDYAAGMVRVIRVDTGVQVTMRSIDPDERQVKLGLVPPTVEDKAREEAAARADEQDAATPEEAEFIREQRLKREQAERRAALVAELWPQITVTPGDPNLAQDLVVASVTYGGISYSADAEHEGDAKNALIDTVLAIASEKVADSAPPAPPAATRLVYSEKVTALVDELMPKVQYLQEQDATRDTADWWVARVETPAWVAEVGGPTQVRAQEVMRAKLLSVFAEEAGEVPTEAPADPDPLPTWADAITASAETQRQNEIDALAAAQAEDAAKDKPKRLLKVPTKGPKPRKGKGVTVTDEKDQVLARGREEEPLAPPAEAPITDDDGKPLGF